MVRTASPTAFLVAVLAVVGVLSGCGQEPKSAPAPDSNLARDAPARSSVGLAPAPVGPTIRTISITVRGTQVTGETGSVTVALGTPVTVSVTSDVADRIHVHGYDRKAEIPAGSTGSVSFTANAPGVFEVGLEGSKLQLVQLHVS